MNIWDNWYNFLGLTAKQYKLSPQSIAAFQARFTQVNPENEYAVLGDLPETQATIFENFVDYYHNYSNHEFPITLTQRAILLQGLSKIALSAMEQSDNSFQIKESLILQVISEKALNQACQLGWLNPMNRDRRTEETFFVFFHPPFQEYFAALAVENWNFFLTHVLENPQQGIYRIFDPLWKQVIFLWLGREDISSSQKEEFIQALTKFEDGCKYDFYGFQSYFLASVGISEYKKCTQADQIVKQIIEYSFGYFDPEEETWRRFDNKIQEAARETIIHTIRETVIQEICATLQYHEYWDCKEQLDEVVRILGKISVGNESVITLLIKFLHPDNKWVTDILGKIALGNQKAIDSLINLLGLENHEDIQLEAVEALGRIGRGNERAIKALINLLHSNNSEDIRYVAIASLGNITLGNEQAILELISLISPLNERLVRSYAMSSLGKIALGNEQAVKALISTFYSDNEDHIWDQAIVNLGEIGIGNKRVISTLIELLFVENEFVRQCSTESLGKIALGNKRAINSLVKLLSCEKDEFVRESAVISLGKIGVGNEQAIKGLIDLLTFEKIKLVFRIIPYILEKIALGNKQVLEALISISQIEHLSDKSEDYLITFTQPREKYSIHKLIEILSSHNTKLERWQAAKSLRETVFTDKQYAMVVKALKPYLVDEVDENSVRRFNNCYEVMWHCAQNLSYPDFYIAWHSSSTTPVPEAIKVNLEVLPKSLENAIQNYPNIVDKVQFICLDGSQFINPDNPALEIYAALVEKGYPKRVKGEPETLQELKVYRQINCPELFLIFYEVCNNLPPQGLSSVFLKQLEKFSRRDRICIITESVESPIQSFSPQLSNLMEVILAWMERTLEGSGI